MFHQAHLLSIDIVKLNVPVNLKKVVASSLYALQQHARQHRAYPAVLDLGKTLYVDKVSKVCQPFSKHLLYKICAILAKGGFEGSPQVTILAFVGVKFRIGWGTNIQSSIRL